MVRPAMDELSRQQRRVVEAPPGRHLLVLAPPGSGKTRTIAERVAYLLATGAAAPDQILAMTFTERAAAELTARLEGNGQTGVTSGTFHRICTYLLRDHGGEIGLRPPLRVFDEPRQLAVLAEAAAVALDVQLDERTGRRLRTCISKRKCGNLPYPQAAEGSPFGADVTAAIDETYCHILQERGALDFDDLIVQASRLLWEVDDVRNRVRRRYRFVFVDEFHDVSPEQYRLLLGLAPPRESDQQMLAVADENQAIFGFRGANATAILAQYRRDYRPVQYELAENFRSAANIVRAASWVIGGNGATAGIPVRPDTFPTVIVRCADEDDEARCLVGLIERARTKGGYGYDEMAVLYRRHRRADRAEAALLHGGVPIHRVRPGRFFDEPAVQEGLRYLDLIAALHDDTFVPALNWPRVLVDEVTMIRLNRLAAAHGIGLGRLAYRDDLLWTACTPLTRTAIVEFRETIAAELTPLADEPIGVIVERLLTCLGRRRDPIPRADRVHLRDTLDYLGGPLAVAAERLYAAVVAGRRIAMLAADDPDCRLGAMIVRDVFVRYLGHPPISNDGPTSPDAFIISLTNDPAATADIVLRRRTTRTVTFSVGAQAWRLAQMVLMRFEQLAAERFVVYDLETSSNLPRSAEILEIGARELVDGQVTERSFHSLVRPSSPAAIGRDAEEVHGIGWRDVAGAPGPAAVLSSFFQFAGDAILAGHFVAGFDDLVVRRVARAIDLRPPANPILDSCALARRLLPDEPRDLATLAAALGAPGGQAHRALPDATLTAHVLHGLLERLERERELDALSELLPLVALSIRASGVPIEADNDLLVRLGARAAALGHDGRQLATALGAAAAEAAAWLAARNPANVEDDEEWTRVCSRWRDAVADYCRGAADHSLPAFLHYAALAKDVDFAPDAEGRVTMLTIHSAKGKEWPVVFVIGAEDDQLTFDENEVDEGRRVFYVAMTRPKERLFILWSARVAGRPRRPTRYLADIPDDLVKWI
jgi:superfamily I DNA/RNA helicase/DNA polymerase III epsilon subunit-like protein